MGQQGPQRWEQGIYTAPSKKACASRLRFAVPPFASGLCWDVGPDLARIGVDPESWVFVK